MVVAVVIEEPLGVKLARIVPVGVVHVDRLVVTHHHRITANYVAQQWRVLLGRMRDSKRHYIKVES